MSRPDAGQLSSNWKKLQEKLKAEKKAEGAASGTKRKREEPKKSKTASNGFKKARLSGANAIVGDKKRKMGGYLSTNAGSEDVSSASKARSLIKDHDIAPADISAAYGAAAPAKRVSEDDINGGIHPTRKIGKYVSLDCEMVGTGPPPHLDNILARASLVNFHGEQIYDSYVQPPPGVKVEDYRTYVSGIKPHHLRPGYARTFKEVQKDVADILEGRILVGHALRNDLNALMLSHPKRDMRDTSRHPKFRVDSKGKPPALRKLAKSELGIEVQTEGEEGVF
ncbi:RNA exonuclease 4 [Pseudocercospora fuligena]|uniref:RNA exonuclease 4 n=1 Tax=Pseudocercospora fuligena TaxID=685502 RepID=A0A8H6VJE9_9PEZI|nr:RNA exonuclease 4 [Pseudocercospora fuligena]